jgi:hypothetical protein
MTHFYKILKPIRFSAGQRIFLPNELAENRKDIVDKVDGELHVLKTDQDFKTGMIVGFESPLGKSLEDSLTALVDDAEESEQIDSENTGAAVVLMDGAQPGKSENPAKGKTKKTAKKSTKSSAKSE